jgi:hypothetical protein
MPADPTSITKFRALLVLDRYLGDPDDDVRNANLRASLERLDHEDFDIMGETLAGIESITNDGADHPLTHFDDHWRGPYFPGVDNDELTETIRAGFRSAVSEALDKNLPLTAVWVCGTEDSNANVFRVDHVAGPYGITVAIVTPRPATR